ncbi:hypothetical protein [Paenibacillus gansuensis]|uniref:Uncharacterized protein n=1 Tax=Paenibacillus gansuensis TaxID=306542 RepID=A0ABW5PKM8_9BACL
MKTIKSILSVLTLFLIISGGSVYANSADVITKMPVNFTPSKIKQFGNAGFSSFSDPRDLSGISIYENNGYVYVIWVANGNVYLSLAKEGKWVYRDKVVTTVKDQKPLPEAEDYDYKAVISGNYVYLTFDFRADKAKNWAPLSSDNYFNPVASITRQLTLGPSGLVGAKTFRGFVAESTAPNSGYTAVPVDTSKGPGVIFMTNFIDSPTRNLYVPAVGKTLKVNVSYIDNNIEYIDIDKNKALHNDNFRGTGQFNIKSGDPLFNTDGKDKLAPNVYGDFILNAGNSKMFFNEFKFLNDDKYIRVTIGKFDSNLINNSKKNVQFMIPNNLFYGYGDRTNSTVYVTQGSKEIHVWQLNWFNRKASLEMYVVNKSELQ